MTARIADTGDSDNEPCDDSGETDRETRQDPPQDRPGQPGVPSRAESRRAAMEVNQRPPDAVTGIGRDKPSAAENDSASASAEKPDDEKSHADEADTELAGAAKSPLEDVPSYGGFDNLAEEFDARAKSTATARAFNTDQASGHPPDSEPNDRYERRYSGELIKVDKPDADADKLSERIGGASRVRFENDPLGREFDAVSDAYIGQAKPADFSVDKKFRMQAKASFDAAQETGRSVYYHFDGPPDPRVVTKLNEYSERYGIEVVIDTKPFDKKA